MCVPAHSLTHPYARIPVPLPICRATFHHLPHQTGHPKPPDLGIEARTVHDGNIPLAMAAELTWRRDDGLMLRASDAAVVTQALARQETGPRRSSRD